MDGRQRWRLVSVYSADPAGNYIYRTELEQLRSSGHEIWESYKIP